MAARPVTGVYVLNLRDGYLPLPQLPITLVDQVLNSLDGPPVVTNTEDCEQRACGNEEPVVTSGKAPWLIFEGDACALLAGASR